MRRLSAAVQLNGYMKKSLQIFGAALILLVPAATAQIASWNYASSPGSFTETGTLANMSASALTVSAGAISFVSNPQSASVASWSTSSSFSTGGKYWQVSITPNSGYQTSVS